MLVKSKQFKKTNASERRHRQKPPATWLGRPLNHRVTQPTKVTMKRNKTLLTSQIKLFLAHIVRLVFLGTPIFHCRVLNDTSKVFLASRIRNVICRKNLSPADFGSDAPLCRVGFAEKLIRNYISCKWGPESSNLSIKQECRFYWLTFCVLSTYCML